MNFDINEIVPQMVNVIKDTVKKDWKEVKGNATNFLHARKDRLDLLASMRLQNEIEQEFFLKRLNDEKKIFESELLSLKIVSLAIAQKAANAAFDVLNKAIESALKII